jgi:F-type H+-transporting ATPase subunit b
VNRTLNSLLTLALLSGPALARAAEAAHGEGGEHAEGGGGILGTLGIEPKAIVVQICGFVLLLWILKKFLFGPLQSAMHARRTEIQGTYTHLEEQQQAMLRRQADLEARLAEIEAERRNRIHEAAAEGQALKDQIVSEAQQQASQIVEQGRQMIRMEQEKAIATLRGEMADLAVRAAGRLIDENLNDERHRRLVSDFISRVGS